ncbi:RHS repeat-associated core domain-containing protein [Streptomyces sp. NPDC051286]|uniref:RHS repeat-associated core domain-containing protein n=1 Tax=Streptomyces sp. NPDC051286 TaxID=3365647 RepID=UPI0037A1FC3B
MGRRHTTTAYDYEYTTGLPMRETVRSAAGELLQQRTYAYDRQYRLTEDTTTDKAGKADITQKNTWDPAENLASTTTSGDVANPHTETYSYDEADRLITATDTTHGTGSDFYRDKTGNRTRTVDWTKDAEGTRTDTGTATARYDARDRVVATTAGGASSTYTYSPRGTLASTTRTDQDGTSVTTQSSFDAFNQLIADGDARYQYDALGRLESAAGENGATHARFSYAGASREAASDGTFAYARDPGGTAFATAREQGTVPALLTANLHQDVIAQRDTGTGAVNGAQDYDPFGKTTARTGAASALGFQGSWTDQATGRVNAQARWYTPDTGTFASPDTADVPLTGAASANTYGYGSANPTSNWDPTGHLDFGIDVDIDIGKWFGAVADTADDAARAVGGWGRVGRTARGVLGRVGSKAIPVAGWILLGCDAYGVVEWLVNQDGSMTRVSGPQYDPDTGECLASCVSPTGASPEKTPRPKVKKPAPKPAPVRVTGTRTTSATQAWSTHNTWYGGTYLYNRTDNYTYTTDYLWTYYSNGAWTKKVSGTSWTHYWKITSKLLIDWSDTVDPIAQPAPHRAVAPESADPATPHGSCEPGGNLVDCAAAQRDAPLPPGGLAPQTQGGTPPGRGPPDSPGGGMCMPESGGEGEWIDPNDINFSQRSVSPNDYVSAMRDGTWDWNRPGTPLRVIERNGQLVSYDNRRLDAAREVRAGDPDYRVRVERVDPDAANPAKSSGMTWEQSFEQRMKKKINRDENGCRVPYEGLDERPEVINKKGGGK